MEWMRDRFRLKTLRGLQVTKGWNRLTIRLKTGEAIIDIELIIIDM